MELDIPNGWKDYKIFYTFKNFSFIISRNEYTFIKKTKTFVFLEFLLYKDKADMRDEINYHCSFRNNRRVKHIYNTMINIGKLKDGRIKQYEIYNELELRTLCQYLDNLSVLYTIYVEKNQPTKINKYLSKYNGVYEGFYENFNNDIKNYMNTLEFPEYNFVFRNYKVYIKVYKGFINLKVNKDFTQKYKVRIFEGIIDFDD